MSKDSNLNLRRANSLVHSDDDESALAHFGVMGMKWGIRRNAEIASKIGAGVAKVFPSDKKMMEDWAAASKGATRVSKAAKVGVFVALGPYWGAKALNAMQAKAADPKEIVKKERKALTKKIDKEFDEELQKLDVFNQTNKEFRAKYGSLGNKELIAKEMRLGKIGHTAKLIKEYDLAVSKRVEDVFKGVADRNVIGTNFKITPLSADGNYTSGGFKLTHITDVEHSAVQHESSNERSWMLEVKRDADNYITAVNLPPEFFEVDEADLAALDEEDDEE